MSKERIIGIDLGTTNSCVSVMEFGKLVVIPNTEGGRTTPSIVHIDHSGNRLVGVPAKKRAIKYPERTIFSVKRHMGTNHRVMVDNQPYSPEQIASFILAKLKKQAEDYLMEPVHKAVVTVPAYFNDAQRLATRHAGKLAGLEVVRVINEPTACSIAYGFHKVGPGESPNIIIFDFGGGTFDVSILNIHSGIIQVKSTNGNNKLGGDDFDLRLAMFLNDEFRRQYGVDASQDLVARQRMLEAAEKAKIELSGMRFAQVHLPFLFVAHGEPRNLEMEVTQDDFNRITEHLVRATAHPIETALKDARLRADQVNQVVLCGGTTRIPAVQQFIRSYFHMEPAKSINPDEAVSMGAAIQGAVITGEIEDLQLRDVISISVNVEMKDGKVERVVGKNTDIPVTRTHRFSTTADSQTTIDVHVLQGEGETVLGNISLGRFVVGGVMPAPAGVRYVDVDFHIDADSIIHCSYKQNGNQIHQLVLKRTNGLEHDELEQLLQKEREFLASQPKEEEATLETEGTPVTAGKYANRGHEHADESGNGHGHTMGGLHVADRSQLSDHSGNNGPAHGNGHRPGVGQEPELHKASRGGFVGKFVEFFQKLIRRN